jgi:hypothetical protein
MRADEVLISAESDSSAWSLELTRGGAGPRKVDARYLRGTWQVDQGHQFGRQVAVVLAWQVTRCAICLRCAGIGCRRMVPGPCRGFWTSSWRASAASSGAPGAAIIVVTGAGMTVLNPGIPVRGDSRRRRVVRLPCLGARSPWRDARGGTEFCRLVCAGQVVLRTVSVAVRAMGRLNARGHGHIADSVGAADADRRRLRRSAPIWCG